MHACQTSSENIYRHKHEGELPVYCEDFSCYNNNVFYITTTPYRPCNKSQKGLYARLLLRVLYTICSLISGWHNSFGVPVQHWGASWSDCGNLNFDFRVAYATLSVYSCFNINFLFSVKFSLITGRGEYNWRDVSVVFKLLSKKWPTNCLSDLHSSWWTECLSAFPRNLCDSVSEMSDQCLCATFCPLFHHAYIRLN